MTAMDMRIECFCVNDQEVVTVDPLSRLSVSTETVEYRGESLPLVFPSEKRLAGSVPARGALLLIRNLSGAWFPQIVESVGDVHLLAFADDENAGEVADWVVLAVGPGAVTFRLLDTGSQEQACVFTYRADDSVLECRVEHPAEK